MWDGQQDSDLTLVNSTIDYELSLFSSETVVITGR